MSSWQDAAFPRGSLILVTGASGFLASHVITEALQLGFRVRGIVRSKQRARETTALFKSSYYYPVIVADLADERLLLSDMERGGSSSTSAASIFQEVAGIIHCASVMTFSPNPELVIPPTVAGILNVLKAAKKHACVKRVVCTSSATAITFPITNAAGTITKDDWNDQAVSLAKSLPVDAPGKSFIVYSASKVQAERSLWEFINKEKPHFQVNCVNPATMFGRVLGSPGETGAWIPSMVMPNAKSAQISPQNHRADLEYVVDVSDSARIHLATLLDATLCNERILAFAHSINQNDIIESIQKMHLSDVTLPARLPEPGHDTRSVDNALGKGLLKKWWAQNEFKTLDETVQNSLGATTGMVSM